MKDHLKVIGISLTSMLILLIAQALTNPEQTAENIGVLCHNVYQSFEHGLQRVPPK